MYSGDCTACFGAFASDAKDKLGDDMVEFAFFRELVDLFFDFWGVVVFYGYSFFSPVCIDVIVVWVKKLSAYRGH